MAENANHLSMGALDAPQLEFKSKDKIAPALAPSQTRECRCDDGYTSSGCKLGNFG